MGVTSGLPAPQRRSSPLGRPQVHVAPEQKAYVATSKQDDVVPAATGCPGEVLSHVLVAAAHRYETSRARSILPSTSALKPSKSPALGRHYRGDRICHKGEMKPRQGSVSGRLRGSAPHGGGQDPFSRAPNETKRDCELITVVGSAGQCTWSGGSGG